MAVARLTDQQRQDRALTEAEFQRLVTDLASLYGWTWVHFRPARTERGWRVPVSGPLGAGWPDLVLVNPMRRRTIAAELKRELGADPTPDQLYVHTMLQEAGWEVAVWRPSDLPRIQRELAE